MKFLKASKDFDFVLSLNYIYKIISGIKVLPTPVVGSVFVNSLKNICIDNETKDSILNMASGVKFHQFPLQDDLYKIMKKLGNNHLLRGKFSSCSITMKVYSCMTFVL